MKLARAIGCDVHRVVASHFLPTHSAPKLHTDIRHEQIYCGSDSRSHLPLQSFSSARIPAILRRKSHIYGWANTRLANTQHSCMLSLLCSCVYVRVYICVRFVTTISACCVAMLSPCEVTCWLRYAYWNEKMQSPLHLTRSCTHTHIDTS